MRLVDADELIKRIPNEEMISRMAVASAPTIKLEPKPGKYLCTDDMFEYAICSRCEWNSCEP